MLAPNVKNTSNASAGATCFAATKDEMMADELRTDNSLLIREAQRGSPAAFEKLVRHYDKAALRLALRLTGSEHDAQDVCQEAFWSAYQNLGSFRFDCSFYTWIYRIVTNRCLDYLRRRRTRHEAENLKVCAGAGRSDVLSRVADDRHGNDPESALAARELRGRIARALERLSPCERTVFELKHYQDVDLRRVAILLNTSEGNARHALFRAKRKLRSALAEGL